MTKEQIEALQAENKTLKQKLDVSEAQNQAFAGALQDNELAIERLHDTIAMLEKDLKALKTEKAKPYTLLKNTRRTPDGKKFDNLYLQIGESGKFAPLAIQLVKFNPKQKNLLLALAKPCEIRRVTLVSDLDNRGASASVIDEDK